MRTPVDVYKSVIEQAAANKGRECIGLRTPYPALTRATGGLRPGHLWILGGYTSTGKSALANEFCYELMTNGLRPVVFSLEMSDEATMLRIAARHSHVPALDILMGAHEEGPAILEAFEMMSACGFTVYDSLFSVEEIEEASTREAERGMDLVVIDFVQNLLGDGKLYDRMSRAAVEIQRMARILEVPVLALSQLSNEAARGNDPIITYKGGGELAAAADVGLWLEGEKDKSIDQYWKRVNLMMRKNRHGGLENVSLVWANGYTKLEEVGIVAINQTHSYGS